MGMGMDLPVAMAVMIAMPMTMVVMVLVMTMIMVVVSVRMRTHNPTPSGFSRHAGQKDPHVFYLSMETSGARQLRKVPPVALATAATILAPMASISGSVSGFAVGWIVTAMASDLRPGSIPCPW